MKLNYSQLSQHLTKQLSPLYIISSDEILLLQEAIECIRIAARKAGYNERTSLSIDSGSDWEKILHTEAHSLSLFANKRIIELHLAEHKPNAAANKILHNLATKPLADTIFIISTNKTDSKTEQTKWYKTLETNGVAIQIWPITIDQLPSWIIQRAKKIGLTITPDAAKFLADQVEGNLLAADQEIEKLFLLNSKNIIDIQLIENTITDNAHFDIFTLVECALSGNSKRCLRILSNLQAEGLEPLLVLWALTRELRTLSDIAYQLKQGLTLQSLFAKHRIWEKRQPGVRRFLAKHTTQNCWEMLSQAANIDKMIKGARPGNVWNELQLVTLRMAGNAIIKESH